MTVSDEATPQDRGTINGLTSHLDIADLVRSLDERARAADERAKAADDRSQALAERVALLESQIQNDSTARRPSLYNPYDPEPDKNAFNPSSTRDLFHPTSTRNMFPKSRLELGTGSFQEDGEEGIHTVVGIAEDENYGRFGAGDPVSALEERLNRVEDRLIDCEEEKRGSINQNEYKLPESTFTLLVTEHPLSVPFLFSLFTASLSLTCLSLVLADSLSNGTVNNRIDVPAGVSTAVRAAQFVGILVGVLFEDECPQGLQHIAFGAGHTLLLDGKKKIHKRLVAVSILRLSVGYLFLSCLFINVIQNSDVLSIFYDVLALEFVENIDDTAFALAKKGFLGQKMLVSTVRRHTIEIEIPRGTTMRRSVIMSRDLFGETQKSVRSEALRSGTMISNSRSNNIARLIYYLNGILLLSGLAYLSTNQSNGHYRCSRIHVSFKEEIWKDAIIAGSTERKLLVYPYFNGIYQAVMSVDGHPRYVEQDKDEGLPFIKRTGAEIRYCDEIESWVFMHPDIESSNECNWLFRSYEVNPETDFDIVAAANDPWIAWTGEAVWNSQVSIRCLSCLDDSDCSYQGICESPDGAGLYSVCSCYDGRVGHFCEFEAACQELATEKAEKIGSPGSPGEQWFHEHSISLITGRQVYNRPVYIQTNLTNTDPFDWRKFDVRQREPTSMPSIQPSAPTMLPTVAEGSARYDTRPTSSPIVLPGVFESTATSPTPTSMVVFDDPGTYYEDDSVLEAEVYLDTPQPTDAPTKPWYTANEYETDVEDFAEHDDFFEMKPLHDLEDIMQNYSVVMSFTGSRFYATIVEPNATFNDIFPPDYHAFWDNSFDVNRTFVISQETDGGTPIGIDFFEMRRRVPSNRHENVKFAYGPYGALIPNMAYEGAGFFHCLNSTH